MDNEREVFEDGYRAGWDDALAWLYGYLEKAHEPSAEDVLAAWENSKRKPA
jgi:hypothetical protein